MIQFNPEFFYDEESLRVQGMDGRALKEARESGELKFKKLGRRILYKGEWLLEFLGQAEGRGAGK